MPETAIAPASAPPSSPTPAPQPAPVSPPTAKQKAFGALRDIAKGGPALDNLSGEQLQIAKDAKAEAEKAKLEQPPKKEEVKPVKTEIEQPKKEGEKPEVKSETPPVEGKDEKKPGPWQLKEKWEKQAKVYEKENVELRSKLSKVGNVDELISRAEKAEAKAKELADEIRYVNFQKSDEFIDKYQKPYEEAWGKAVSDMKELTVTLEDGSIRPATANDLLTVANMTLGEARSAAKAMFGDSADDVMAHRRVIRELADAQKKALEDARKDGDTKFKQARESAELAVSETARMWEEVKAEDVQKREFLKPKEGDDEWNSRLAQATKFVDGAFSESASDPKLTAEQRLERIRKHSAVRGRAIAYSIQKVQIARLQSQIADMQKKLDGYTNSDPKPANGHSSNIPAEALGDAMAQAKNRLRGMVKP